MESTMANLVEPGDVVLIGTMGYFGERLAEMAKRYGGDVKVINKTWGEVFTLEEIEAAVNQYKPRILGLVHAETSTGAMQPIQGIGELCRQNNCLFVLDTVTSLCGVPVLLDEWKVDASYSCTQKCIGSVPGLGPVTFGPRAMEKINSRKTPIGSWYFDISLVSKYWSVETSKRSYHHTAPTNNNFGLYEGLRIVLEEGIENRWNRHIRVAEYFYEGLQKLGLECVVQKGHRIPHLTTIKVPNGVDAKAIQLKLIEKYNIEISGGLGTLAGKVWRVGLMGVNATFENVDKFLAALADVLGKK